MDKERIQNAITELKKQPSRKFIQSYDLIINLKNVAVKQNPLDFFVALPFSSGRKVKIAAFIDQQLAEQAQKNCDEAIKDTEFPKYASKKEVKKLAVEYDYFIAQMNLMPKVAATFGKVLGARGKMPNPKQGCVVPPNINLEQLCRKLRRMVRLEAKKATNLQCIVGKESQPADEVAENILAVYNAALKQVPNEEQNIKDVFLKTTMGKPVRL